MHSGDSLMSMQDTESFYTTVQQEMCARYGKTFTWELKAKMMGRKALPAAQTLVDELGIAEQISAEEFVKEREERLHALFPQCQLLPGVRRLIEHLKQSNVPMCVATSSHQRHFELKTQQHKELFALFDHIITGDAVHHGKPAPEIFQTAAAAWQPPPDPSACLVFEDALLGVEAGVAADMHVVMVPDAQLDTSAIDNCECVTKLSSLEDFVPERFGLPPFPS